MRVLSDVDFAVAAGHVHGLIGPNGVGKTTLLRIIAGLVAPTSGSIRVLGDSPVGEAIRSRIGWIPGGDRTFYLRLSGCENLLFFARMYGLSSKDAGRRSTELLERVGLAEDGHRLSALYSKGMLKRLAIARALLASPQVLLCDETTHDLDPEGATTIRNLVRGLTNEGVATVWATQRLDELAGFADSVTVLSKRGVAFSGDMEDLLGRLERRTFALRLSPVDQKPVDEALDGLTDLLYHLDDRSLVVTVPPALTIGSVVAALIESGITVIGVNEIGSDVEAAYRSVLGQT